MPDANPRTVELVEVQTSDGLRLNGALHLPAESDPRHRIDAVLFLHGTGSNFYGARLTRGLTPAMLSWGSAVLAVNTRGHDLVSVASGTSGPRLQGAAYEMVGDCVNDIEAWLQWLGERGYTRVALVGHSLGAVKAVYAMAEQPTASVACMMAISPPRLSYAHFSASAQSGQFLAEYARADQLLAAGEGNSLIEVRFPLPYVITAAGYVDKYGPGERYNVLNLVDRLPCPTLFTYGTVELRQNVAFAGMPELLEARRGSESSPERVSPIEVAVVADADHVYSGVHAELAFRLERWLRGLSQGQSTD